MSALITVKMHGDTEMFRTALAERSDEFAKIGERARREGGAIHHRFGVGDGVVVIVDEWESPAHFEKFFSDPDLQAFIGSVGGDTGAAPDITVTEAITSSDQF